MGPNAVVQDKDSVDLANPFVALVALDLQLEVIR